MLIYIRRKRRARKNRVIKAIEILFTLLGKKKDLVISALTSFAVDEISRSTVHTAIGVNNRVRKNHEIKTSVKWLYCCCLTIQEMSMIDLLFLVLIHT